MTTPLRTSRASRTPEPRPRPRRGLAMPMVLLMLVVLSALAAGAFTASRQTFRGGRNAVVEQRALAVSEYGLNQQVANWRPELNLPAPRGLAVGAVDSGNVWVAAGDSARVRITRLTPMLYQVESMGRASIPNPMLTAARSVSAIVRLAYPSIQPRGAITAGGRVEMAGSSTVDGRDWVPYTWDLTHRWSDSSCAGLRGPQMPAVAVPPGTNMADSLSLNYRSIPRVAFDAAAADSNTYVRFGTETWNTLAANASPRYTNGNRPGNGIEPTDSVTGTGRVCRRWDANNWGEPWRGSGSVPACYDYYPIIYVDGDLNLQSNGRGQGILLVNGSLRLRGNFDWMGLIIVRDDVERGNGSATITGAVMARNVNLGTNSSFTGNQDVRYSKCAIESVLRGSAVLVRAKDRAWTQTF